MFRRWMIPLVLMALAAVDDARGCATVSDRGHWARIADQSAIIIWDAATKTEHFIRRATFNTDAADFGFLVPTPTRPTLGEVSDSAFDHLKECTAPRTRWEFEFLPMMCMFRAKEFSNSGLDPVRVLEAKRVAGLDAVVLQASDPTALGDWLEKYGYAKRKGLEHWLSFYVKGGWTITAFKYVKESSPEVVTKAVHMSFKTDAPFYPYRVPSEQREADAPRNFFRVYFLGAERMSAKLGTEAWHGGTAWADRLTHSQQTALFKQLGIAIDAPKAGWYLTEFVDRSWPSQGSDELYFEASSDQLPVHRYDLVKLPVGDMLLIGLFFVCLIWFVRKVVNRFPINSAAGAK